MSEGQVCKSGLSCQSATPICAQPLFFPTSTNMLVRFPVRLERRQTTPPPPPYTHTPLLPLSGDQCLDAKKRELSVGNAHSRSPSSFNKYRRLVRFPVRLERRQTTPSSPLHPPNPSPPNPHLLLSSLSLSRDQCGDAKKPSLAGIAWRSERAGLQETGLGFQAVRPSILFCQVGSGPEPARVTGPAIVP